VLTGTEGG
jgi:hypothetical protein